jgi:hypothetical protein
MAEMSIIIFTRKEVIINSRGNGNDNGDVLIVTIDVALGDGDE